MKERDNKYHRNYRKNKRDRRYKNKRQEFLLEYKRTRACEICDYNEHTEILVFHHKDPYTKEIGIAGTNSLKRIKLEMEKCILLCPNCHRWLHYNEEELKPSFINKRKNEEVDEAIRTLKRWIE